jgi:RNA polymerase sigma factor for flagellar operon FliA
MHSYAVSDAIGPEERERLILERLPQVRLIEIRGLNFASLEFAGSEDGRDLLQFLPDKEEQLPSALFERSELEHLLAEGIEEIPKVEQTILSLYYHEELTLREISQVVKLHESRISQLKSQAILRLHARLAAV